MADRHPLRVTWPDDLADQVRAGVATGQYANEDTPNSDSIHLPEGWRRSPTIRG